MAEADPPSGRVLPAGPLARVLGRRPRYVPAPGQLAGRTALVTGAAAGIGLEIARALGAAGARVVLACRTEARAREALTALDGRPGAFETLAVDLSSLAAVRAAAAALRARLGALHILVNNAGVCLPTRRLTPEGFEETWVTNVLAYHLLAAELLPLLRAGAPARIVDVASTFAGDLDLEDLDFARRRYSASAAYRQSKQANRMLAWARAEALAGSGVAVNVAHPGWVATGIIRHLPFPARVALGVVNLLVGRTPAAGAETPVWLAAAPELEGATGGFYAWLAPRTCEFRADPRRDLLLARVEAQLAGIRPPR